LLTSGTILGCRWRITYDKTDEGRIQARLFANPAGDGGKGNVDILLNMIFHRLEPFKTELEWSYVVISGEPARADRVIDSSNAAFRSLLKKAQFDKSTPEKMGGTTGSASGPASGIAGMTIAETNDLSASETSTEEPKKCSKCGKSLEPGFAFCIYCGAAIV